MTREQYIENIKGRLDELTKDELKDVSMLTAAQLKVRQAVVEKETLMNDITALKSQCEDAEKENYEKQQPEVPQFVAEFTEKYKGCRSLFGAFKIISNNRANNEALYEWVFAHAGRQELFAQAWTNGYTVAEEKRFYLKNKLTGQRLIRLLEENGGGFLECVASTDKERMQFTQSEIDSMAAESYEQIEVEE